MSNPTKRNAALLVDAATAAAEVFGVSERQFHELRKRDDFPAAIYLGPRTVRYRRSDLEAFIAGLEVATTAPEPAQLVAGKAKRAAERGEKVPA